MFTSITEPAREGKSSVWLNLIDAGKVMRMYGRSFRSASVSFIYKHVTDLSSLSLRGWRQTQVMDCAVPVPEVDTKNQVRRGWYLTGQR